MEFDIVEMVVALEEGFGIDIANIDVETLQTAGDLHTVILTSMWRTDSTGRSPNELWSILVRMFEDCGARPGRIRPETRLVDLLGLD
jgi:hypothetical protein